MEIHVGTSGYAYKEWKGGFYPEKIAAKDMLRFYSERLGAVEINNTFYRMPNGSVLTSWADQVPDGFVFAVKAPRSITHIKRLKDVGDEADYLFRMLSALGGKLGPVLFQFPEYFPVSHSRLREFLGLIPSSVACAFAFRNASWLVPETFDLLRARGCSLCLEDTDESPIGEIISTASWGYLRLRRPGYTDADLSRWAESILAQSWDRAFVFFKHEEEAKGAKMALRFGEIVGRESA